jgi:hypothetical protein
MKRGLLILAMISITLFAAGQTKPPVQIHVKGCVRQGIETCLLLRTFDGKTTYEIEAKKPPKVGDVVDMWGIPHGGSLCLQGIPFTVVKWRLLKIKCPLDSK